MFKKQLNIIKILINFILPTNLPTNPILLEIEPVNYCDLDCLMCPNREMLRKKGYMSFELFKSIVDQTIDTTLEYSFGVQGEPTLHQDLIEMIKYIKEKNVKVTLNSNLNYKNEELNSEFIKVGVDRIIVTISGTDKEKYEEINCHGNFERVIKNLTQIQEFKRKLNNKKTTMVASFARMKINLDQCETAKKDLQKYFDYVHIAKTHDWLGNKRISDLKVPAEPGIPKRKCSNIYTTVTVLWDGRISACCHDYEGKIILGDANTTQINNVWRGSIKGFRKEYKNCEICQKCPDELRTQFSKDNIYYTLKTIF